jgi:hypothetical protein
VPDGRSGTSTRLAVIPSLGVGGLYWKSANQDLNIQPQTTGKATKTHTKRKNLTRRKNLVLNCQFLRKYCRLEKLDTLPSDLVARLVGQVVYIIGG